MSVTGRIKGSPAKLVRLFSTPAKGVLVKIVCYDNLMLIPPQDVRRIEKKEDAVVKMLGCGELVGSKSMFSQRTEASRVTERLVVGQSQVKGEDSRGQNGCVRCAARSETLCWWLVWLAARRWRRRKRGGGGCVMLTGGSVASGGGPNAEKGFFNREKERQLGTGAAAVMDSLCVRFGGGGAEGARAEMRLCFVSSRYHVYLVSLSG
ncbi:hypothetical protein QBC38DRAFT_441912 [Podospora fimiseda]|uniref:Uncharacterized protein n=1 Tax=Podospora fimiseda TaxID=252190 RepID=A0AAN7H1V2_9PEZI|nr:hypothetical protein QBC38DRAFT_441912 [Podospora fimiseda]